MKNEDHCYCKHEDILPQSCNKLTDKYKDKQTSYTEVKNMNGQNTYAKNKTLLSLRASGN